MMYITKEDVKAYISNDDIYNALVPDDTFLELVSADVDTLISTYALSIPTPTPEIIKLIKKQLLKYELYTRHEGTTITETLKNLYVQSMVLLQRINNNSIQLVANETPNIDGNIDLILADKQTKIFN